MEANILAMTKDQANYDFFNVGTGIPHSIADIAAGIIALYKKEMRPEILNKFRAGDIRHCYADITKISAKLGFKPKVSFEQGMKMLIEWSDSQSAKDLTAQAQMELKKRGLAQ